MPPKISIALATYNGADYLQEQLESFRNQARPPDELVVSDDASTDQTLTIAEVFAAKAPFSVHVSQNHACMGSTKNFESAVSKCTGDIIFLADQDDVWLPTKIELMAHYLTQNSKLGAIFCDARMCDEKLGDLGYNLWQALWFKKAHQQKVQSGKAFEAFLQYPMVAGMTLAFRSRFRDLLLPFPEIKSSHDVWITLLCAAISKVDLINKALARHRVHASNLSGITLKNIYKQYLKARSQINENRLQSVLELHKALQARLSENTIAFPVSADVEHHLNQKIKHSQIRANMPESAVKRLPFIYKELANQRYRRYSYGYKGVLQDLLLR